MIAAQPPLAQLLAARIAVWNASHPAAKQIDPQAELAIAQHEGLSGGIGDNGTSFGPNQLHLGGAFPQWAPHATPQQAEAWANSPAGIDYTLGNIAQVAGGLKGLPSISAIATKFERPANPQAEIADAAAHYGLRVPLPAALAGYVGTGPSPSPMHVAARVASAPPMRSAALIASPSPTRDVAQTVSPQPEPQGPSPGVLANLMMSNDSIGQGVPTSMAMGSPFTPYTPLQNLLAPTQRLPYQPLMIGGR